MAPFKLIHTWEPVSGKKQEYVAFITGELQPLMQKLGLEMDSEWYTLIGPGPQIRLESLAPSMGRIQNVLSDERLRDMLERFQSLVRNFASTIFAPASWDTQPGEETAPPRRVKFLQAWNVLPGCRESCESFLKDTYLPQMAGIGLPVTGAWRRMVGSGRGILCEALAPDLSFLAKGFSDDRYLQLTVMLKEQVTNYGSWILMRHRIFLSVLQDIYGEAIRAVPPDILHPMVGPLGE